MTLAFRYAARTDVGLVRDGNEDSGYAGPNLLAVADGMGGAVAGELASAITIETVRQFDSAELDDPVGVLSDAASAANGRILSRIKADPRLDGMGTTLTAGVLYDGSVLGLVHIGDSRAYLLRDGELKQLTHDHTFVQSLVDEGKLTPQQAEHHPHRSLIIRVLDGHHDVQLDIDRVELHAGDWLLFCSDGLGNADIRDSMIASALAEAETPEEAALELIRKALRAGSPDNVTCVVAEVVDLEELGLSPERAAVFLGSEPMVVGAAAEPDLDIDQELEQDELGADIKAPTATGEQPDNSDDAEAGDSGETEESAEEPAAATEPAEAADGVEAQAEAAEATDAAEPESKQEASATAEADATTVDQAGKADGTDGADGTAKPAKTGRSGRAFRWALAAMALSILAVLAVAGARFAFNWTQDQYYVGSYSPTTTTNSDEHVAIFRGVNQKVPGIQLSSVLKVEQITLDQLPANHQRRVEQTISVNDLDHAVRLVSELQEIADSANPSPAGNR